MYSPQVSLLCRPSPSSPPLLHHHRQKPTLRHCLSSSLSLPKPQRRRHIHLRLRAFSSPNSNPNPDLAKDPIFDSNHPQSPDLSQRTYPSVAEEEQPAVEAVESGPERKSRLPLVVFLVGILESVRRWFDRLATSEWLSWWPFWQQEKRLERLIAEADANPKDAVKQGALLAELNQHSPESVIRRFEQRNNAVDSKGVAEYLRALVVTNALAEYLPDERLGRPSSLPTLLQELKQHASGNEDEAFLNPGVSEKQPLHVVMVDRKASSRSSWFAQELLSTVLFTVVVGLMCLSPGFSSSLVIWHQTRGVGFRIWLMTSRIICSMFFWSLHYCSYSPYSTLL